MKTDLQKFIDQFTHGHIRNYHNGYEIRVQNFDASVKQARVLEKELKVTVDTDVRLKSIIVLPLTP